MNRNALENGDIRMDERERYTQQPLKEEEQMLVTRAYSLFEHFREGLAEQHEQMREARKMRGLKQDERSMSAPPSNTLNSCVDHVIADQTDNLPEAKLIPEREETVKSAEEMSDVLSYVLHQAGWSHKYQTIMEDAIVTGTGIAEVFWDDDMDCGNGMVNVLAWHPEDFYPDPTVESIQDGRAVFKVTHTTVAWVEEHYPDVRGYVMEDRLPMSEELYEAPDGDARTTLLEFWYKRYDAKKRRYHVHMAQMAGGALLFSTQTGYGVPGGKREYREGVYAHGMYPFVMYKYRDVWRCPFGTGVVYDYRETQNAIDRYRKYIDDNARASSVQRIFLRRGCGVNADDVADMRKNVIEWEGSDIREVMQTVQAEPLNGQIYQIMEYMADCMKQDCGQNQFIRGEAGQGVTAASAIQSLQEAGSKLTRWHGVRFRNAFREMVEQILWVMSEYLSPGRTIRIVGGWDAAGSMREHIVTLKAPQEEGDTLKKPAYTVRVEVQKSNPMQVQADNEFLLQAAQICAQYGQPMPPRTIISLMEGYRNKRSVLQAIENSPGTAKRDQVQSIL